VASSHPQYARVEGTSFQNGCSADAQCHTGGCSNEVCSAEQGVSSTCEAPVDGWPSAGSTCGCVKGQCVWYKSGKGGKGGAGKGAGKADGGKPDGAGKGSPAAGGVGQGESCAGDVPCAKGLTCVKYYGIAGPRGPEFASCERRCSGKGGCPSGQSCVAIADGPGEVCRPN
jgi:eight-cysteine-cluster-containing protein